MTLSAPRYGRIVLETVRAVDDRREPLAEVCRRVNEVLEELGRTRVSYVHLRRVIRELRIEEDQIRAQRRVPLEIVKEMYVDTLAGLAPDFFRALDRVERRRRAAT